MNIIINDFCNLKCPYCFAEEFNANSATMTVEQFSEVLDWMRNNNVCDLNIVGGEPTIHPHFEEILELYNKYLEEFNASSIIYTNGIELEKYIPKLHRNTTILINTNSPEQIGETKWNKLMSTLDELNRNGLLNNRYNANAKITLGCNIYTDDFSTYDYIWDLVDKYNLNCIRISICFPANDSYYICHRDEYYQKMKNVFMQFQYKALEKHVRLLLDCSQIPSCYFTGDELAIIYTTSIPMDNITNGCGLIPCILPNLNVAPCFSERGFDNFQKPYRDFNNVNEIYEHLYINHVKNIKENFMDKCEDCILKEYEVCHSGCLGFMG